MKSLKPRRFRTPPKPLETVIVLKKLRRQKAQENPKEILCKTTGKKKTFAQHYAPTTQLRHCTQADTLHLLTARQVGNVTSISSMRRANSEISLPGLRSQLVDSGLTPKCPSLISTETVMRKLQRSKNQRVSMSDF